ncbi:MAG: exlusion protein FxsA [Gammaproteobacteria bacterium SG8_47]|nr:MAG: exlusion protein FxsA [Gammaproteobacteria bacterium SG8_47]
MSAFQILFLALIVTPLIEIYLLIKVGGLIGAWPTVFLVVFTAVLGALLLRQQGFATLNEIRGRLDRGEIPATSIVEGGLLLAAGALLLTPGFATDSIGFALLIAPLRRRLAQRILASAIVVTRAPPGGPPGGRPGGPPPGGGRIIDGEFQREDD